jgi:hypothetical protein
MARFLDSLARRDTERFLKSFSRTKPFRYIGTIEEPYQTDLGTYTELARDLATKDTNSGWYSAFFDGGPDDAFSRHADNSKGKPWKRIGKSKFVPPDHSDDSRVFVIWREERGQWFIDAIGEPGA